MLLRVRFDDPGWFASSPRLLVSCDGNPIYEGAFSGGFDASIDVAPGRHTIETAVGMAPGIVRKKRFRVDVPSNSYRERATGLEARLIYSRLWGNFRIKLELRRSAGDSR